MFNRFTLLFCTLPCALLSQPGLAGVDGYQAMDVDWKQIRPAMSARQSWRQMGIRNYRYRLKAECMCVLNGVSTVYVLDSNVIKVEDETGRQRAVPERLLQQLSVPGLYALIDRYAVQPVDSMAWRMHRSLGYPTLIHIDPSYRLADDGLDYSISDLKVLQRK